MTEATTDTEDQEYSPFSTTDEGYHIISSPVKDHPEELEITIDGVTYHLSEYMGTLCESRIMPNTICYRSLDVRE